MERLEFEARVRQASLRARTDPGSYRRRTDLLVLLGIAVPIAYVAVATLVAAGMVALMVVLGRPNLLFVLLLVASAGAAWTVAKALFLRPEPIDAEPIRPGEAPQLHALVRAVAGRVRTTPPEDIYLLPDLNAFAREVPRTTFLATGSTTAIGIGLPLLHALDPEELATVLAHEFGHLSGRDGLFAVRVQRLRRAWAAIVQRQARTGSRLSGIVAAFGRWYLPRLEADTLARMRAQEQHADALARSVGGDAAAGRAFLKLYGVEAAMAQPGGWARLDSAPLLHEQPPTDLLRDILEMPARPLDRWDVVRGLVYAWQDLDDPYAEHPAPRERLLACGTSLATPGETGSVSLEDAAGLVARGAGGRSAAVVLLGQDLDGLSRRVCACWSRVLAREWPERRKALEQARTRYEELSSSTTRTVDETMEMGCIGAVIGGTADEESSIRAALAQDPSHAAANHAWGCMRIRANEPDGVPFLEYAMERDPALRADCARRIAAFHAWNGRPDQARAWREQLRLAIQRDGLAFDEGAAGHDDEFVACDDERVLHCVAGAVAAAGKVDRVDVARKVLRHRTAPVWVVAITPRKGLRSTETLVRAHQRFVEALAPAAEELFGSSSASLTVVWDARDLPWQTRDDVRLARSVRQVGTLVRGDTGGAPASRAA